MPVTWRGDGMRAVGEIQFALCIGFLHRDFADVFRLAFGFPTFALGFERSLLSRFKCADSGCVLFEERVILFQTEGGIFDAQLEAARNKVSAQLEQFALAHRIETDLIEETQQPGLPINEIGCLAIPVPHLHGTSNELIAAWALHAVDAEVSPAYAHRVLRRPCPGRVVLGGYEAMARVHRRRHGRAKVDVASPSTR